MNTMISMVRRLQGGRGGLGTALSAGLLLVLAGAMPVLSPAAMLGGGGAVVLNAASGVTLIVQPLDKVMSDNQQVRFWVFCQSGGMNCSLPGPTLELGVGQTANVTLDITMAPQENPPYQGHTIHPHGLDVPQSEDGVPETGAAVLGDNYSFSVDSRYVGSHMYHCHVHTVKHLEMGMYAAFVVKAVDSRGNFLNVINSGGPAYDYEMELGAEHGGSGLSHGGGRFDGVCRLQPQVLSGERARGPEQDRPG